MQSSGSQKGVMLIEALVAILIFTLGIVAVMGLQANSMKQMSDAKYRTDASYLASQVLGMMWMDQGSNPWGSNLTNWQAPSYSGRLNWDPLVASTLPNGAATITVTGIPPVRLVTVQIRWKQPEDTVVHSYTAVANIQGTTGN
jgi:type IV pilus assembly protein PilV